MPRVWQYWSQTWDESFNPDCVEFAEKTRVVFLTAGQLRTPRKPALGRKAPGCLRRPRQEGPMCPFRMTRARARADGCLWRRGSLRPEVFPWGLGNCVSGACGGASETDGGRLDENPFPLRDSSFPQTESAPQPLGKSSPGVVRGLGLPESHPGFRRPQSCGDKPVLSPMSPLPGLTRTEKTLLLRAWLCSPPFLSLPDHQGCPPQQPLTGSAGAVQPPELSCRLSGFLEGPHCLHCSQPILEPCQ